MAPQQNLRKIFVASGATFLLCGGNDVYSGWRHLNVGRLVHLVDVDAGGVDVACVAGEVV